MDFRQILSQPVLALALLLVLFVGIVLIVELTLDSSDLDNRSDGGSGVVDGPEDLGDTFDGLPVLDLANDPGEITLPATCLPYSSFCPDESRCPGNGVCCPPSDPKCEPLVPAVQPVYCQEETPCPASEDGKCPATQVCLVQRLRDRITCVPGVACADGQICPQEGQCLLPNPSLVYCLPREGTCPGNVLCPTTGVCPR